MYRHILIALISLVFVGYEHNVSVSASKKAVVFDTSLVAFKSDPAYRITVRYNEELHISLLRLLHGDKIIFTDKLPTMLSIIRLNDMDNDGIDDLLILNSSSARSNESSHLYLLKDRQKKLLRVKGFENVFSPVLNKKYNIIEGSALWGQSETRTFYRIYSGNKLRNLGYTYDHKADDGDKQYRRVIKMILKKRGDK